MRINSSFILQLLRSHCITSYSESSHLQQASCESEVFQETAGLLVAWHLLKQRGLVHCSEDVIFTYKAGILLQPVLIYLSIIYLPIYPSIYLESIYPSLSSIYVFTNLSSTHLSITYISSIYLYPLSIYLPTCLFT